MSQRKNTKRQQGRKPFLRLTLKTNPLLKSKNTKNKKRLTKDSSSKRANASTPNRQSLLVWIVFAHSESLLKTYRFVGVRISFLLAFCSFSEVVTVFKCERRCRMMCLCGILHHSSCKLKIFCYLASWWRPSKNLRLYAGSSSFLTRYRQSEDTLSSMPSFSFATASI